MNWVTIIIGIVIVGSTWIGLHRRFARELNMVIYQIIAIVSGLCAIWAAWLASRWLSHQVLGQQHLATYPSPIKHLLLIWHNNPNLGTWVLFVVCYLIVGVMIRPLTSILVSWIPGTVPTVFAKSRLLGGIVGFLRGAVRIFVLGGAVFIVLQYISLPVIATQVESSKPYQFAVEQIYRPWLKPFVARELPVFADGALTSLSHSIDLFAIPTGVQGQEQGILVIPTQVAQLSKQITDHVQSPRDKAYVLYEWEIHHIHYDWHKYDDYVLHHQWDQQSPLQTLTTGKGVCADYALLYADLAHAAGLEVRIVEGMGGTPGQLGSHAWNQVWNPATNRWMYIDTTWGSQQDDWFNVPFTEFKQMHFAQTTITIPGGSH